MRTEAQNNVKVCSISVNRYEVVDRLCGLAVRVPGYRSRGPGSISGSGSESGSTQPHEYG
jgi:hypothetical protein